MNTLHALVIFSTMCLDEDSSIMFLLADSSHRYVGYALVITVKIFIRH